VALIEGVMGLFDGYSGADDTGSTAHLARLLQAPVVLVVDASAMARSAAAVVRGFRDFDPRVLLAGVVLNRVGGEGHARLVQAAIEAETGLPVLGYLAHNAALALPERHLGLVPTAESGPQPDWISQVRQSVEATVNVERILALAEEAPPLMDPVEDPFAFEPVSPHPVIAVARDAAFNFIYEDNLELLRAAGAEIVFFSPLADEDLPGGTQALYLCGGFPEVFAADLARNFRLHAAVRAAHRAGLPIYAECGGLMVLIEAICDLDGAVHPMVGALPGRSVMTPQLTLGYREFRALGDSWLWQAGETMRGHEFHHSTWRSRPDHLPFLYELQPDALVPVVRREGASAGNLMASYTHLHFLSRPKLATRFVQAASQHTSKSTMP
jgi:cobyrinic acid a,c-diamide synthase